MSRILFLCFLFPQTLWAYECGQSLESDRLLLMINPDGHQDLWNSSQAQDLSFCISSLFSKDRTRLEEALRDAAQEWMNYANVNFQLAEDLTCRGDRKVLFEVIPAPRRARYAARAFFPYYEVNKRIVRVKRKYIEQHGAKEMLRLMLHELGHVLGFRHEHTHAEQGGTCFEDDEFEALTDYDSLSIMHYSRCLDSRLPNFVLSEQDKQGATKAYPFP